MLCYVTPMSPCCSFFIFFYSSSSPFCFLSLFISDLSFSYFSYSYSFPFSSTSSSYHQPLAFPYPPSLATTSSVLFLIISSCFSSSSSQKLPPPSFLPSRHNAVLLPPCHPATLPSPFITEQVNRSEGPRESRQKPDLKKKESKGPGYETSDRAYSQVHFSRLKLGD